MTLVTMENVEVFETEKKGRGLRATKDLAAGQVVFAEPSFAAVVFDSLSQQVCHSCFRRQEKLHRCAQCRFAHYCDRTCQRAGWEEHKQECTAIKKCGKAPNENVRLAARILWRKKTGSIISDGQLTTVEQLQDHVTDMAPNDLKELKVNVHDFLDYWPRNSQKHGVDSISHIFGVINCNGFTLSDQRGLQAVGVGLFPNLCLVNHDCWPNCTVILNHGTQVQWHVFEILDILPKKFDDLFFFSQMALNTLFHTQRRIELRTLEKISEGDELTVSYIDFLNVSSERQRILRQQYFFDCTCQHCTEHLKDDLMMAVKDSNKKSDQDVKEVTEFSVKTVEKIEKARVEGNYKEVVKLCRECLGQQEPVLGDTHLYLLRVLSLASEVLSYLHDFSEAAGYARRMVEGYMKLYHPNNAQLGMATMRAGVTLWQAGQIEAGHSMLCKANGILMITHGPSHSITKDLEAIRLQAEMELQMFQQNEAAYYSLREAALKRQPMSNLAEPLADNIRKLFRGK